MKSKNKVPDMVCALCGKPSGTCIHGPDFSTARSENIVAPTRSDLLTRIKSLEEQNAKLREAVKVCEKFIHSVGGHGHLFFQSCGCGLLMKKALDSTNALELEPKDQHVA